MQTFLPFSDFSESARTLDNKRLNKQKVEGWQIINALMGGPQAWANHPAVKMWRGHEGLLVQYLDAICNECESRGIQDHANLHAKILMHPFVNANKSKPFFIDNKEFHDSHKLNLLYKDLNYYGPRLLDDNLKKLLPSEKPAYVWPVYQTEYLRSCNTTTLLRYSKPKKLVPCSQEFVTMTSISVYTRDKDGKKVTWLLEN